ncbi:ATP-binding protein [Sphaerimonospora thailandensis]|uniref:Histidine kinase/HSP90-like ATPase domain-containing protein n=1 Tax=Sphaerimonospora thailandensis TaxID=795644 RepID=A0A8J3R628_9ACTN|nr:ATP-binding protein [Sphaerimonospora thailandensis]GIH69143.1 hypothetical protein Mth01_13960 [Sphaerimonospora thailandensis]
MLPTHAPPAEPLAQATYRSLRSNWYRTSVWCLPPRDAPRRARLLLRERLSGIPIDSEVVDELELVISELATNAIRHAPGPYELRILYEAGLPVHVEVAVSGNGAALVDRLLDRPLGSSDGGHLLTDSERGLRIVVAYTGGRCGARTVRLYGTGRWGTGVWFEVSTPPFRPQVSLFSSP